VTRVLVVDDKEENLYYLSALLQGDGCEVVTARNGAEALELARHSPPDLVISDLLMPVMDGYTLLRHWKADPRLGLVPFVVYTATYTEPEDEQLALHLGADAFILKPAEPDDFLARLRAVRDQVAALAPPTSHRTPAQEEGVLREYSETLIRKLEHKTLELELSNRALQRDIAAREATEAALRETEAQLRQAQKMEAVGRLAGGIAHDFNNLLSVIMGYSALALEQLSPDDPLREDLDAVHRAGERATLLTRQLLAFSRQQLLELRVLDLRQVVEEAGKLLLRLLGEDIELRLLTSRPAGNVLADASQLEQIIMNLAVNARDAMPRGGKLTIEVGNVELDASFAASHGSVVPGPYVMLAVSDTGTGIDAATRERIFEPFFTTKEKGKGTGLGLSTVFGIVSQSRGQIYVYSEPGVGTTFKVYFPCTDRALDTVPPLAPAAQVLTGSETVLLVEDDEQVRALNASILRRNGYQVIEAEDGSAGVLASQRFEGPIDLLLTDVVMPRLSGRELAERVREIRPAVKVLYVSGYTNDSVIHHGILEPGHAFVQKPLAPNALLRKVREVLDAPGARV